MSPRESITFMLLVVLYIDEESLGAVAVGGCSSRVVAVGGLAVVVVS